MTQHGSFPGRPRGRRARPDNDGSEWAGYDATPADQREFPDLAPIRPREARSRDGRVQGDWQAQGQAGSYGAGYPGGPGGQGYAPTGPGQGGQAPWQDQAWPGQQPAGQQMTPPAAAQQTAAPRRAAPQDRDEEAPSWAGPDADAVESFSQRWHRRGLDTREDRRADRAKRRRMLIAGAVAGVLVVGGGAYAIFKPGHSTGPGFGALVTSFLPGEIQQVPNACHAVPATTIGQYLPGNLRQAAPPLNVGANTSCTWTLDKSPMYRVLEVQFTAYSPSALYGNGSATVAAEVAYSSYMTGFQHPGPKSGQPAATVTDVNGMPGGNDTSAFEATQVFDRGGATTDIATVLVRYRNVIVTVVLNGLDHSNKGNYGPVSMSDLVAAAQTVAKQAAGQVVG